MKDKKPYLGIIFDLKKIPYYAERPGNTKEFLGYQKEYSNKRWALYCSCGHLNEVPIEHIKRNGYGEIVSSTIITCNKCSMIYKSLSEVKMIYSRNPSANVTSKRFGVIEKDEFYALYSFATVALISVTTKKIVFKDFGNRSLYFSKKISAIRIKNGEKILTVPLKFLVKHSCSLIDHMTSNALQESIVPHGLFERQVIEPLLKFCKIVESKCDQRDVERLLSILDKEREDIYFSILFDYHINDIHSKTNSSYSYSLSNLVDRNKTYISRHIWIQYFKRRLSAMLLISMYSPLATIALTNKMDDFLRLFYDSSLMCSLTNLRKKRPTNPKDILEVMFKGKVTEENSKNIKIKKFIQIEERKRKRKLKVHPENKKLQSKITEHPIAILDSRVPISKNIKDKLKNIQFKKSYIDLFMGNKFDSVTPIFYGFLNNNSVFDSIDTVDKFITNSNTKKEALDLLCPLQSVYENNRHRLLGFQIDYKTLYHIFKIIKNSEIHIDGSHFVQIYADTIFMLRNMEQPLADIFKNKSFKELEHMHHSLTTSYRLKLDSKLSKELQAHILKYKHTNDIIENIQFSIIETPEAFYEESAIMNHCVKTYVSNVAKGNYVIYSVIDKENGDRATLSISRNNNHNSPAEIKYAFNQLKGKFNSKSSEKIITSTKKFIEKHFQLENLDSLHDLIIEPKTPVYIEDVILNENNLQIVDNMF